MFNKIYFYLIFNIIWGSFLLEANYINPYTDQFNKQWNTQHTDFFIHAIPKCGTHFIQKVIQLMIPKNIIVSSAHIDALMYAKNLSYVVRSSEPYTPLFIQIARQFNYKVIAMIRDPRDALISHVFYMRTFANHPGQEFKRDFFQVGANFDHLSFTDQITSLIEGNSYAPSYIDYYQSELGWALDPYSLAVKFEDLVSSAGGGNDLSRKKSVLAIASYLNMDLCAHHLDFVLTHMGQSVVIQEHEGQAFRRASTGNWKNFLNEEHKQMLKEKIGKELILLGYEQDFNW